MNRWPLLFTVPLVALGFTVARSDAAPEINGSLRQLSQVIESAPLIDRGLDISATTLRLEVRQAMANDAEVEFALENQWLYSAPPGVVPLDSEAPNTRIDLSKTWREEELWSTRLHVDRLYLHGGFGPLRWSAGRQPFGFGNIVMFSPLDVIAPFPPDAIDTEYRPGVDALRLDYANGAGDLFGAVAVLDELSSQSSYLATGSFNRSGIDLQVLAGELRDRPMGGMGLAGYVGGLGLKGELAWYEGKRVGETSGDRFTDFPVGAVELWYRFANDLILLVEYLHNGAGGETPVDYQAVAASAPIQEGLTSLLGQNYLLVAPSYELHPLMTVSALGIWNLDDDSYLLRPQVSLSLSDNLSLDISHTLNRGKQPTPGPLPGLLTPRSEFGLFGDSAALYLRWYF